MDIKRTIVSLLKDQIQGGKVVILYGPRRAGKTTSLRQLERSLPEYRTRYLAGDDRLVQAELASQDARRMARLVGDAELLIVDEAQSVPQIGQNLKLLVDSQPSLSIIASGSASFDLSQKVGEPLTGRKKTLLLYPLSVQELLNHFGLLDYRSRFEELLLFGQYPESVRMNARDERRAYLRELTESYLYRDLLQFEGIRHSKRIHDLLTLIAFQVGKEVSINEVSSSLGLAKNTVAHYLDLLEKNFVLVNVRGFSRNLRKEVTKTSRYYFYDNGVRNALINNFNPLALRDDIGALWENWIVMERLKLQNDLQSGTNNYFWRTYDQKEIDWIEEKDGKLHGFEFSWKPKSIRKAVESEFTNAYPGATVQVVHQDNHLDFLKR